MRCGNWGGRSSRWWHLGVIGMLGVVLPVRAQVLPTLAIAEVAVSDVAAYGRLIEQANQAMRERHGVPLFLRAYGTLTAGGTMENIFSLRPADTLEHLAENAGAFAADPELRSVRMGIDAVARTGAMTYLKAIRFDGTNAPGFLINTQVKSGDEADLLLRVEALVETLRAVGLSNAKLNVFRVIEGDGSFTHLVSINLDSPGNAAKAMDAIGPVGWDTRGSRTDADAAAVNVIRQARFRELGR
jgi:hypothetical protein